MNKALAGSCVLILLLSMPGSAKETFAGLIEEMIKLTGSVGDVLSTVKDKETVQKAMPKVKELGKSLKDIKARADKLGKPTPEDIKLLEGKYGEKLKASMQKMITETVRVGTIEGGPELLLELDVTGKATPGGKTILKKEGKLTDTDPKDKEQKDSFHKVEIFAMAPGATYTIDLQSKAFDSYLRLEDSTGKELASDDDGGGNLNSRIVFTPTKQDKYRIIITTFQGGQTGDYTLLIRQADGDKKGEEKKEETKKVKE